jgi:hypothetical protein
MIKRVDKLKLYKDIQTAKKNGRRTGDKLYLKYGDLYTSCKNLKILQKIPPQDKPFYECLNINIKMFFDFTGNPNILFKILKMKYNIKESCLIVSVSNNNYFVIVENGICFKNLDEYNTFIHYFKMKFKDDLVINITTPFAKIIGQIYNNSNKLKLIKGDIMTAITSSDCKTNYIINDLVDDELNVNDLPIIEMKNDVPNDIISRSELFIKKYHPDTSFNNSEIIRNDYYKTHFTDSKYKCQICKIIHNGKYIVSYFRGEYYYGCSQSANECLLENDILNPIQKWNQDYNSEYMLEYPSLKDGQTLLVQAHMGSGKTYQTTKWISNISADKSILVITYRRTLARKHHQELVNYGFDIYLEKGKYSSERLIVCLDSLYRLEKICYDYVIVDEIDSVLSHFQGDYMRHVKKLVIGKWEHYIKNCGRMLVLDANVNNWRVYNSLSVLRDNGKFICVCNRNIPSFHNGKEVFIHDEDFTDKIMDDVGSGLKIGVISMSCSWATKMSKMMGNAKVNHLVYTSQTREDKFDNLVNDWSNEEVRVIIYSPSISSGVSFDESGVFDKIYAYGINVLQGPSVDDFKQMLFRIRRLIMGEIHLYFDSKLYNTKKFEEGYGRLEYKLFGEPEVDVVIKGGKVDYCRDKFGFVVWSENVKRKYNSLNNFKSVLFDFFKEMKIKVSKYEKYNDIFEKYDEVEDLKECEEIDSITNELVNEGMVNEGIVSEGLENEGLENEELVKASIIKDEVKTVSRKKRDRKRKVSKRVSKKLLEVLSYDDEISRDFLDENKDVICEIISLDQNSSYRKYISNIQVVLGNIGLEMKSDNGKKKVNSYYLSGV